MAVKCDSFCFGSVAVFGVVAVAVAGVGMWVYCTRIKWQCSEQWDQAFDMSEDQLGLYPDLRTLAASVDVLGARLALGKDDKQGQPSTPAPCKTSRARGGAALAAAHGKPPKLAHASRPLASDVAAAVKAFADALARSSRRATSLCVQPASWLLAPV